MGKRKRYIITRGADDKRPFLRVMLQTFMINDSNSSLITNLS